MKKNATVAILASMLGILVVGAAGAVIMNWDSIVGKANDISKAGTITLTQLYKKADYTASSSTFVGDAKVTVANGVITYDNTAGSAVKSFSYSGNMPAFTLDDKIIPIKNNNIYYTSVSVKSTAVVGAVAVNAQLMGYAGASATTTNLTDWFKASSAKFVDSPSGDYNQSAGYVYTWKTPAAGVSQISNMMFVNIQPIVDLGAKNTTEAKAVFETITAGAYFEGDKTFLKSEVLKAISDYETPAASSSSSASA